MEVFENLNLIEEDMVIVVFVGYGIKFDLEEMKDGNVVWILKFYFCFCDMVFCKSIFFDENLECVNDVDLIKYYLIFFDDVYD